MPPKPQESNDKELKLDIQRLRAENSALQSHVDALKNKLNSNKHELDQSRLDREQRDIDEHLELVKLRGAFLQAALEPTAASIRAGIKEQLPILEAMAAKRVQPASRSSSPVNRSQKRKRASSVRDDSSSDDEEQEVTTKARRPYKRRSSVEVKIERPSPTKRGPGRPKKNTKYRGRGRPRKSDVIPAHDTSDDEDAPAPPPKRGRGRPKKSGGTPPDSDTDEEVASPSRRKPGRPRKLPVNGNKSQESDDEAAPSAPRKRGPGRPKKQPVEDEHSQSSDDEVRVASPPKRARGRPKKSNGNDNPQTSDDDDDDDNAPPPPKRGPGRPKKQSTSTVVKAEALDAQLGKFPADQEIESGTLVWVKTQRRPWYPAVVFDEDASEVPAEILTGFNSKEQYIVRLFNSEETWVCVSRIKLRALGQVEELDQDMMASISHFQGLLTGGWNSEQRDEVLAAYQNATGQATVESDADGEASPVPAQDAAMDVAADSEDEKGLE